MDFLKWSGGENGQNLGGENGISRMDPVWSITDHRGQTDYKLLLDKIQEVYRLELEQVKHLEEECTARIHELLRQQSRTRSGSFAL